MAFCHVARKLLTWSIFLHAPCLNAIGWVLIYVQAMYDSTASEAAVKASRILVMSGMEGAPSDGLGLSKRHASALIPTTS